MLILLDVTRTLAFQFNGTPTGIDRVEHALIRWLLTDGAQAWPSVRFVITTPYNHAVLSRSTMAAILQRIEARWAEEQTDGRAKGVYRGLRARLSEPVRGVPMGQTGVPRFGIPSPPASERRGYWSIFNHSLLGTPAYLRTALAVGRQQAVYIHSSHALLEQARLFRWLERASVPCVFYLHDIIPIDFPEYCGPEAAREHRGRLDTVARQARAVIANSEYTSERITAYCRSAGLPVPNLSVSHLGNVIQEYRRESLAPPETTVPYFVCIGTIEGRKNLPFLLNVWRRLIQVRPPGSVPRLVIVGRRGWECETVIDILERTVELAPYLIEVEGLRDIDLASLLAGATAVLAPSSEEGYGLPPVEALQRGVPVVASDIPAHREVLNDAAILLDPTDGVGWRNAIIRLVDDTTFRLHRVEAASRVQTRTWSRFAADTIEMAVESAQRR